jgi:hypothetical protein
MRISDYPDLLSDDESSFLIAADWLEEQSRNYEAECLRQGYVFGVCFYLFGTRLNYALDHGYGYDHHYGAGYGYGYGYGDGAGAGAGYGYGYGDGAGYSAGDGDSDDLDEFLLMFFAIISQGVSKS